MPFSCRAAKRLDCLSHLIYTVQPCLFDTCLAAPVSCRDHAILKATSQGHGPALQISVRKVAVHLQKKSVGSDVHERRYRPEPNLRTVA
jgi:hypothetical protein